MPTKLSIIGSGGHAKVVVESLNLNDFSRIGILDENRPKQKKLLDGFLVERLSNWHELDDYFHVAIGSNKNRSRISNAAISIGKMPVNVIHRQALISKSASLHDGIFVAANSIVASEAIISSGCIINHAAIVDHDCYIGEYSHIAPNATLGGGVRIGKECLIGAGATILPNVTIGSFSIIGAGSVVTKDVPENSIVFGNPAIRRFYESN